MADGPTTVEFVASTSRSDAQCRHCGADVELSRTCPSCGRGNLAAHSFCGWCGDPLLPTVIDPVRSAQITLLASTPCESGEMTLVSPGEEAAHSAAEGDVTVQGATDSTIAEYHSIDGVAVVLLGSTEIGGRSLPRATYRIDLGEPFDVAAPDVERPATFTATVYGLRFDALGDLNGVYIRLRGNDVPVAFRRVRVEPELGNFQAVAPGETLPIGCLAIIGNALVRIEAIAS